ncbi:MAG: HMA2 domain-containing protein [Gammaproteobacteria bacterium]
MSHQAHVAHHIPGRIRLSILSARGNESFLDELRDSISRLPGVAGVVTNAITGSVLVRYDPDLHGHFHRQLNAHCKQANLIALEPPAITEVDELAEKVEQEAEFLAAHSRVALAAVNVVRRLDRTIKMATGNLLDLRVLLPLGLAVWAFFKAGSKLSTPLWVTLGISALNSFVALHPSLTQDKAQP